MGRRCKTEQRTKARARSRRPAGTSLQGRSNCEGKRLGQLAKAVDPPAHAGFQGKMEGRPRRPALLISNARRDEADTRLLRDHFNDPRAENLLSRAVLDAFRAGVKLDV